jgi:hypothetical protein
LLFKSTDFIENTLRVPFVFWQLFKEKRKPTDPSAFSVERPNRFWETQTEIRKAGHGGKIDVRQEPKNKCKPPVNALSD